MKFSDKPKWKLHIIALLCVVGIVALAGGSYAAYTRQAYQRGVARNRDTERVSFTSNYLQLCSAGAQENSYAMKNVVYGESQRTEDRLDFDIYVYNYANGNTSLVSQKDITYTMKIEFKNGGNQNYTVACDEDAAVSVTDNVYQVTKTLIGRNANENKFTISFPGSDLDQLQIIATAIPADTTITNNQMLAAILVPCTSVSTNSFRADGTFIDKTEGTPQDYDAFNYEVSISGGTADAVLTWDNSIVEIDKFFLKKIGKTDDEIWNILNAETKPQTLSFPMSQSDGTGDYLIPFYIKNKSSIPATWDEMKNVISFDATQAE